MRAITQSFAFFVILSSLAAGCGVRTALDIHEDGSARADGSVRDGGLMDAPWDGGNCTSDLQCDDDMFCNGFETCVGGHCQRGAPRDCNDGVSCTADQCVEGGGCVSRPNDALCPPGLRCDPMAGCVPNTMRCRGDFDCDDRQACNGIERCEPSSGTCISGTPMFCGDGVSCTDDSCIEGFGCAHSANSAECPVGQICNPMIGCETRACGPTGTCDDGDPCNGSEFCGSDGRCFAGSPLVCNDGSTCTIDFCVTGVGCQTAPQPEICGDGADNDCNGLVDCRDPACNGRPGCTCVPTGPEFDPMACSDGRDNDCDGLIDCAFMGCQVFPFCRMCMPTEPIETSCFDGIDNDCNGPIDCADPSCARFGCGGDGGPCGPFEFCANGVDDDCNGATDCADPACFGTPGCGACSFPENCHNGIDDDCNGPFDCMDPWCLMNDPTCGGTCVPSSRFERRCADGVDDDCDGRLDCADPDCNGRAVCSDGGPPTFDGGTGDAIVMGDSGSVTNELGVPACTNGIDDDRDGRIDCADPDCRPLGAMGECCNGVDDNGDGNIDELTCRCFDNSFCPTVGNLDQVCWTSTYSLCAPRCNFYGGDAFCANFMLTTCDAVSGQCH